MRRPAGVAVSPDGSVAIADWGLAEVVVLGPGGEWLGAVTSGGEGPGEVRAPVAVTWVDANTLLILDVSAFRMVTLDLASHSASVTPVAGATLAAWPRSLLGVGAETWVVSNPDGRYELEVFDRDGTSLVRFCHAGEALPLSPAERERAQGMDAPHRQL